MLKAGLPGPSSGAMGKGGQTKKTSAEASNGLPLGRHPKGSGGEAIPEKCPKKGFLRSPTPHSASPRCQRLPQPHNTHYMLYYHHISPLAP